MTSMLPFMPHFSNNLERFMSVEVARQIRKSCDDPNVMPSQPGRDKPTFDLGCHCYP